MRIPNLLTFFAEPLLTAPYIDQLVDSSVTLHLFFSFLALFPIAILVAISWMTLGTLFLILSPLKWRVLALPYGFIYYKLVVLLADMGAFSTPMVAYPLAGTFTYGLWETLRDMGTENE